MAEGADLTALTAYMQALAHKPVPGVNVHARPQGLRPVWIAEETIEPVPFGAMSDPVSQLAFLASPGVLRGIQRVLETAAQPTPRLGPIFGSEQGSLGLRGPQPWPADQPLPPRPSLSGGALDLDGTRRPWRRRAGAYGATAV